MKKQFSLLILLILVLSFTGIVACSPKEPPIDETIDGYYVISDFESEEEFFTYRWHNEFGKASLSTNPDYVTHGNGCLELEVWGNVSNHVSWKPSIFISTDTEFNNRTDYSKVEKYEMDIYNNSDRDVNMYFQFNSLSQENGGLSTEIKIVLKANQMNNVEIDVDRDFVSKFLDISQIGQFIIKFDNRQQGETPAHIFIDRFFGKVSDTPIADIQVRADGEIESANKSEFLSAWLAEERSGTALSFNSEKKYIIEGEGSFKWTAAALGFIEWPRIDLVRNTLTDISGYQSLYFWIYNDNADDYPVYTDGNGLCGTAIAGEWTLIEMPTSWLASIKKNDTNVYDLTNFNNFQLFVTNENKELTFYIDAFYARKAGEPIKGEKPQGVAIELSATEPLEVSAGAIVTVPTVTNADAYNSISWAVYKNGAVAGIVSQRPVDGIAAKATSFVTAEDSDTHVYTVRYTAVDKDGLEAKAVYTIVSIPENTTAVAIAEDNEDAAEKFIESVDSRREGALTPTATVSDKFAVSGDSSVRLTANQAGIYAFTYDSFNMNQCDNLHFFFYNDGEKTVTIESFWGWNISIEPQSYATYTASKGNVQAWISGGCPDVAGTIDKAQFNFYLGNVSDGEPLDLYFSIIAKNYTYIPPFEGAELSFTNDSSKLITASKTFTIGESGDIVLPDASETVSFTWATYFGGVLINENSPESISCAFAGEYTVVFTAINESQVESQITYTVYLNNGEQHAVTAADPATVSYDGLSYDSSAYTTAQKDGLNVLKMQKTRVGTDPGFVWNSGITGDITEINIYLFNASDGDITYTYHWGVTKELKAGSWTKVTMYADMINVSANGNGSQVVRDTTTDEWKFIMHFNENNVAAGGNVEIYLFSTVTYQKPPAIAIELSATETLVVTAGATANVPSITNTNDYNAISWVVYKNGTLDTSIAEKATSFVTPDDGDAHIYTIRYTTVDINGHEVKTAYNIISIPQDTTAVAMAEDNDDAAVKFIESVDTRRIGSLLPSAEVSNKFAVSGDSSVRLTANQAGIYAFTYDFFNMEQCDNLYFFFYNDGEKAVTVESFWGWSIKVEPKSYATRNVPKGAAQSWISGGCPDVTGAIDKAQFSFYLGNLPDGDTLDLYFSIIAKNYTYIPPAPVGAPELSFTEASKLITESKTFTIGESGDITLPTANETVTFTWKTYWGGNLVDGDSPTSINCSVAGEYTVVFTAVNSSQVESQITYTVFYEDGEQYDVTAADPATVSYSGLSYDSSDYETTTKDGLDVLKLQKTCVGQDPGFVWNSGITGDITEINIYLFNASDGDITYTYHWGVMKELKAGSWTKVTMYDDMINVSANGNGSQVVRDTTTDEWKFIMHFNENSVPDGGNVEIYMFSTVIVNT